MRQIKEGTRRDAATGQVAAEDLWHVYAEWHEAVHMAQLVTCPYVRDAAWNLLCLARAANRKEGTGTPDGPTWRQLGDEYEATMGKLQAPAGDEVTAWHVIETYAVVQSLRWLTGSGRMDLRGLADHLYSDIESEPPYVRLVNDLADKIGDEVAIALLPRLCFLALQTPVPLDYFGGMCLRTGESSPAGVATSSPEEFCKWAA